MKIVLIDYEAGNITSVLRSFEKFSSDVVISKNPQDLKTATHIVLPGVGSFKDSMEKLNRLGFIEVLNDEVKENKIPFLGICVGMQLLASFGDEGGKTAGLNFIEGEVKKFIPTPKEPVPHVGWNEIHKKQNHAILEGIEDATDFYFVHSYRFIAKSTSDVIATTPYLENFPSIIARDNIIGVQFHPEKSQISGFKIIENFLKN